jgi:hypothetical protein
VLIFIPHLWRAALGMVRLVPGHVLSIEVLGHAFKRSHRINLY